MTRTPRDLSRLLRPASIAVLGGTWAERVVTQCRATGFEGEIWPVTPSRSTLGGIATLPDLSALPAAPDAAFIAVNRHAAVDAIGALAELGAGGAVCFASGFAETGEEGRDLQAALVDRAGEMPVLGPNCYGIINYLDGALLWPDQHGGTRRTRGVAIISQSGNIAINLTMQQRGVPIAFVATLGNQAQTGIADLIRAFAHDPRVTAIGIYLEGIGDAAEFAEAVANAETQNTPVVVLKAGRSRKGAELALTHTGSLAGAADVMDAYFRDIGAITVPSVPTLLEALKITHVHGRLPGNTIVTLSCSGGEALLVSDRAETLALDFRPFTEEEKAQVDATTHPLVTVDNPFDYHTFDWGDWERAGATYSAVLACGFDMAALVLDVPRADRCATTDWDNAVTAWRTAQQETNGRAAVIATMPELLPEATQAELLEDGIVPLVGLDDALLTIAACAAPVSPAPERAHGLRRTAPRDAQLHRTRNLTEHEAKLLLSHAGVPVPSGALVTSPGEARAAFDALGPNVAMKAVAADLLHKTELGAVRLGLTSHDAVRDAYIALAAISPTVRLEQMAPSTVAEIIVGIRHDPVIGFYLLVGSGGILTEVVGDSVVLILPTSSEAIRAALLALRSAVLLAGFRGRPAGDIDAAVAAIHALAVFAQDHADTLDELEINPLLVHAQGAGVTAVDAVLRVVEKADPPAPIDTRQEISS